MNPFKWSNSPIRNLMLGVFLGLLFFGIGVAFPKSLETGFSHWHASLRWLLITVSISLVAGVGGYLWFPSGIITLKKKEVNTKDPQALSLMLDGRKVCMNDTRLPQQFKVYFPRRGEYKIYCCATYTDEGSKTFTGSLNLYDGLIAHTEIEID